MLLTVAHLSDLHVCDAQSPARVEFIDRWADPDSPVFDEIGEVGTYRAQEFLTTQVLDAMVRAVNGVDVGPVGGAPVDFAIVTGDNTDNAQTNELDWYLDVLDGGTVVPDSGADDRYEGVADATVPDERFWHPDAPVADLPRSRFGFPTVAGLLDAARAGFAACGLDRPWLAVHGNHDQLLQGSWPDPDGNATGSVKPIGFATDTWADAVTLMRGLEACRPDALAQLREAITRDVTPDERRRIVSRAEFVAAHLRDAARPTGHGFPGDLTPYYRHDHSTAVTVLVLDTVNEHGGWDGSLDPAQASWLSDELSDADRERRYVVLASHHTLATMVNATAPDGSPRVLGSELAALLEPHPSLVLWLNGHEHRNSVVGHGTWWEVTAPSLIDWPQQARIVELLRGDGVLTIATTMLDHAGDLPWTGAIDSATALAGLSRELAANDWQTRNEPLEKHWRTGTPQDRNVLLTLADPWA